MICEIAWKVGYSNIHFHGVESIPGPKVSKVAIAKGEITKSKKDDGYEDPQFQEFLQVMQPHSKSKLWANDALAAPSLEQVSSRVVPTNNFILQSSKTFKQQSLLKLVDIHEDGIVQSYNLIQNLLLWMAFPTLQRQFEDIETRNKSNQT
ncbi:Hypothetical predicted protein [Olea europaea subsp. europaea]|uniref:Uncharacterized protein n=1 Tax=Olea europaea subsp. europaea TaxID=158383 RepID=A0A8S0R5U3_OLEEU|nr:Hypothetical predicted protein [Olea europaea subsp. europaea]